MPHAVLPAGVRVRIVGAGDLPLRRRDLVLAAALLAVVPVLVQREPVVARALVRPGRVLALVLAAAVVHGALVHVCENSAESETVPPNSLDPHLQRSRLARLHAPPPEQRGKRRPDYR